jgi:hypothetical protein
MRAWVAVLLLVGCAGDAVERRLPEADYGSGESVTRAGDGWLESAALLRAREAPTSLQGDGDPTEAARRLAAPHQVLGTRLAPRFDEGFVVSAGASKVSAAFIPEGGRRVEPELRDGLVIYREAWTSTDVVYAAGSQRLKETIVLHDASAPHRLSFRARLDGLSPERRPSGDWQLLDTAGRARLLIERPWLVDARGERRDLDWLVEGDRWALTIPDGLAYPIVVDPIAGTVDWTQVTGAGPIGRSGHAMAFDAQTGRIVLFGGVNASGVYLNDTWVWNGSTWSQVSPPTSPTSRANHAMAYDPPRQQIVMTGGRTSSTVRQDTWTYMAGTWAQGPQYPIPINGHAMVHDGTRIMSYGGSTTLADSGVTDRVFLWTGSAWSEDTSTPRPPARTRHGMATAGLTVVYGGYDDIGVSLPDTWSWDPSTTSWTDETSLVTGNFPSARLAHAMVGHTARGRVYMMGGVPSGTGAQLDQLYEYNPLTRRWALAEFDTAGDPVARSSHALTYIPTTGDIFLFGGTDGSLRLQDSWLLSLPNAIPVMANVSNTTVAEGVPVTIDVNATDADGDTLIYAATPMPTGATFNVTTGVFTWTPGFDAAGDYTITFTATDDLATTSDAIVLTVTNVNRAPSLSASPATSLSVAEGATVQYTLTGSDPDTGDSLTFTDDAVFAPDGDSLAGVGLTRTWSWTPGFNRAGTHTITFTVTDAEGRAATVMRQVTVTDTNRNPVLTLTPSGAQSVGEGSAISLSASATDPDGDTVTIGATGTPLAFTPDGATFTSNTFNWTPGFTRAGVYPITFNASDGNGGTAQVVVNITVTDTNRIPTLSLSPPDGSPSVVELANLSIGVTASDPDGTAVTLTASGTPLTLNPDAATFTGTGGSKTFNWTPGSTRAQATRYPVTFSASDGVNTVTTTVDILVTDGNQPPALASIGARVVSAGTPLTFTISASDPEGNPITYAATNLPTGATFNASTRTFSWTPTCGTSASVQVTFTAGDGTSTDSETVTILVNGGKLEVTPDPVSFGTVRAGETADRLVTVTNRGSVPVTLSGLGSNVFAIARQGSLSGTSIGPTGSEVYTFRFTPTLSSPYSGTLTATGSDGSCTALTAETFAEGTGVTSDVSVSQSMHGFGDVLTGTTTEAVELTVTNGGTASYTIAGVSLDNTGDFTLVLTDPSTYPSLMTPGDVAHFTVVAHPDALGLQTGEITILTDAPGTTTIPISLSVTGVQPDVALTLASVEFGAVDVDAAPVTIQFPIGNGGTAPLSITGASLASSRFSLATVAFPLEVLPGDTTNLSVTYDPVAITTDTATLIISTDAPGELSIEVPVNGRGVDQELHVSPTVILFDTVRVGRSVVEEVRISNQGDAPLTFGSPAITIDDGAFTSDALPATLGGDGEIILDVTFTPNAAGLFEATLTVHSDDTARPMAEVTLQGTGEQPPIMLSPPSLSFMRTEIGRSGYIPLEVTNTSETDSFMIGAACVSTDLDDDCDPGAAFAVSNFTPQTVGPMSRITLDVGFTPLAPGAHTGRVLVFVTGDTLPYFANATGEGFQVIDPKSPYACAAAAGRNAPLPVGLVLLGLTAVGLLRASRGRRRKG